MGVSPVRPERRRPALPANFGSTGGHGCYRGHFPSAPVSPTIEAFVTEVSVNPGAITMAKAIERYFNVALYLLVLSGFSTLALTGGLDLPA